MTGDAFLGLIILVAAIAVIVAVMSQSFRQGATRTSTALIRGSVPDALRQLQINLSSNGDHRTRIHQGAGDSLVLERYFTPGWAVAVAILLFPIGLLALAAPKHVDRCVITAVPAGEDRVQLTMAGTFNKASFAAIDAVIVAGSQEVAA